MANRFQYTQRAPETWQQRSEQSAGGFVGFVKDNVKMYSAKAGDNCIRPLPPTWPNAKHYGYDIWVHYNIGLQKASLLCPLKMYNKPCPVCERVAKLDAEGRTDDAKALIAKRRVLVWLVDRKEPGEKPQVWAMPWTVDRDITATCRDRQTGEIYYIDHPDTGYDVSFEKKGVALNTDYLGVQIARRPSPVEDKFLDYAVQNPLPGILLDRTYQDLANYLDGGVDPTQSANDAPVNTNAAPPWQQPTQMPPANFPPQPPNLGVQVPTPAPWQQPQAPMRPQTQIPQPSLCTNTVRWQDKFIGCGLTMNHPGPCDMSREVAPPIEQPQPTAPITRETVRIPEPQTNVAPSNPAQTMPANPPQAAPPADNRVASLRARFENKG